MRWAAVLVLCACNQIFGLRNTRPFDAGDAQFFDMPVDAPFSCPMFGTGPPSFSILLHQAVRSGDCTSYTTSAAPADVAVATCVTSATTSPPTFAQGTIEATMLTRSTVEAIPGSVPARLSPDGDEVWLMRTFGTTTPTTAISVYAASPTTANAWSYAYDAYTLPVSSTTAVVSTPMRAGPNRTVVYVDGAMMYELRETAPHQFGLANTYRPVALGVDAFAQTTVPNLSPDGLRLVFLAIVGGLGGHTATVYIDRANPTDAFVPSSSRAIATAPDGIGTPFLAADCSRLYFSGVGNVLYIEQQ
jgi:hypothetical protein